MRHNKTIISEIGLIKMKLLKYFIGSLIISFGILLVLGVMLRAAGVQVPDVIGDYLLIVWVGFAIVIMPFAKNIIRVE